MSGYDAAAIEGLFVELFLDAHSAPPPQITLDLDATDDPLHGHQEDRFFHGYYDTYCYLPLYVFCGRHLLASKLRPANIDASAGSIEEVARIVAQIRRRWPTVRILLRADSGFAREALMAWCENNDVDFLFGLAKNARLNAEIATELAVAQEQSQRTGQPARRFRDFTWQTRKSWNLDAWTACQRGWWHMSKVSEEDNALAEKFFQQAIDLDPTFAGGYKGLVSVLADAATVFLTRCLAETQSLAETLAGRAVALDGGDAEARTALGATLWRRGDHEGARAEAELALAMNPNLARGYAVSIASRPLLEDGVDVFIRFNEGLSILKKVFAVETGESHPLSLPDNKRFDRLVSSRKPFGLETTFKGKVAKGAGDVLVYQNGGTGFIARNAISTGADLIDKWKLFAGYAAPGTGNKDTYPHRIISTPFVAEPGTISSETYLCIGPFDSKNQAESVLSYLSCRLTRLLILLHKPSQHVTRKVYSFVPTQEWTRRWTDEDLFAKYGISASEIAFIEKVIRPMDLRGTAEND